MRRARATWGSRRPAMAANRRIDCRDGRGVLFQATYFGSGPVGLGGSAPGVGGWACLSRPFLSADVLANTRLPGRPGFPFRRIRGALSV